MTVTARIEGKMLVISIPIEVFDRSTETIPEGGIIAWLANLPDGASWTEIARFWSKRVPDLREALYAATLRGDVASERTRGGGRRYWAVSRPAAQP